MTGPVAPQTSFQGEVKDFVLSELRDLGASSVIYGLEGVLASEAGHYETTGVTPEMRDGTAAAAAANADMVAMALGHPPAAVDPEVEAALAPLATDLRQTEGLADLAERTLAVVADRSGDFAGTRGECETEADFLALLSEIRTRLALARDDYPGRWDLAEGEGAFRVTMHPEQSQRGKHG